jgi:PKD repeat protein
MLLSSAKATLQAAIDALGDEGGTVYIDDGDYVFTSESDAAVVITTPVKVIGLSHDPSKVTITRTGTPKRNFRLNHEDCGLEFVTVSGGSAEGDEGVSVSLLQGVVSDCVIRDANCGSWNIHGALSAKGTSRVVRCIFYNNRGGWNNVAHGVALKAADSAVVENCLFYANRNDGGASNGGGTVHINGSARLVNCTIAGNSGNQCTGVYINSWNARVQNCAIYGNTASSDETGHCHIWNGNAALFENCASDVAINDSCFALAPGFRDAQNNDYTLSSASELIDAGLAYSGTVATSETDLAGNAREVDGVDIGCYEYTKNELDVGFTASVSAGLAPVEVTFVASVFGASGDITYAWDFDNDGTVDKTTTEGTVTNTYEHAGLYSITLKVTTESGATKSATLIDEVLVSPKTVYANSENAAGAAYPYDTPETATPDLALAIDTAGDGSTVIVEDGTYAAATGGGFLVDKNIRILSRSQDPSKCVVKDLQDVDLNYERRVMTVNHQTAIVSGLTLDGGYQGRDTGATLRFGVLGGMVSNCVIRAGYVRDWGGDAALAYVSARGVITHSILENGLARDDYGFDTSVRTKTSVRVEGLVDNCLIRDFNREADNQNVVIVNNGGKLLNCTVVDGLCGFVLNGEKAPCYGVRANTGARVENCAIVGFRHVEDDESVTVRAWTGEAEAFASCATDTAEPINGTCVTVTTAAFRDYAAKDYRPTSGSPLIGKGKKNELADGTDLVGNRRASGAMDIGCYEAKSGFIVYVH